MDWTHSNSIFFDENTESVFVSIRNLSRITKIDHASQALIWNMGESDFMNETYFAEDHDFSQQHSVQVLDNGNLLFFDNHRYLEPELSRCMEIAYDENEIGDLIYNADLCVSPGNVGLTAIHTLTYGTPVLSHANFPNQMPEFEAIDKDFTSFLFS